MMPGERLTENVNDMGKNTINGKPATFGDIDQIKTLRHLNNGMNNTYDDGDRYIDCPGCGGRNTIALTMTGDYSGCCGNYDEPDIKDRCEDCPVTLWVRRNDMAVCKTPGCDVFANVKEHPDRWKKDECVMITFTRGTPYFNEEEQ